MRGRRFQLFGALAVVTLFVACTLNPQPLPPVFDPNDDNNAAPGGSFGGRDSGSRADDEGNSEAATSAPDAGALRDAGDDGEVDAGDDAGDAGDDAGDAGDDSDDALD